jgi:hypothetical protein
MATKLRRDFGFLKEARSRLAFFWKFGAISSEF